ncbi:MAG: polyprenyl synthetase family protein [Hoeflea sp.]|uniref:polyprenyl synthetase family protein n=1 Tax=Hoeflea sp. TaxID=1940281 RepID=UPI0032EA97D4
MDLQKRIDRNLEQAITFATAGGNPSILCDAMRYAVFPGGARIRPRLCLAVALAAGDEAPNASSAAATAIELLHCASLVHDDLPCFDDAATRRGKPSVHTTFGETTAVLAGDAMIVLAFETIARECLATPDRIAPLIGVIGRAVGMPHGIIAGQAWESEKTIDLKVYHRAKTSSLFIGSTTAGAIAAGADPQNWYRLGEALGDAFQVADDLRDCAASAEEIGKPCGQDVVHDRPNAVHELGLGGAVQRLQDLIGQAAASIPDCRGSGMLKQLILDEAKRLVPKSLATAAA